MSVNQIWFLETVMPCQIPTPNTVFVFDEKTGGTWWKWDGIEAISFTTLDAVEDQSQLLAGNMSGNVNQLLEGVGDLGQPITGRWATKWHDMGQPDTVKIFRAIHLQVDQLGSPIQVAWEVDDGKASSNFSANYSATYRWNDRFVWNNAAGDVQNGMFWGAAVKETLVYSLPQSALGRRIRFTFSDTSAGTPFRILGYQLYFRIKRQRYMPREK